MTAYSVLAVTPTSQEGFAHYLPAANKLVAKHGGKYPARTAANAFMADPDYQSHFKARVAHSVSHHFLLEGKDDLA